jgi:hypothetical protein
MVDAPLPGYAGPVARGALFGGLLGGLLGAALGYGGFACGFDVSLDALPIWAVLGAGLGAIQGASHLALLRHRQRQSMIYGVDLDDHDHGE